MRVMLCDLGWIHDRLVLVFPLLSPPSPSACAFGSRFYFYFYFFAERTGISWIALIAAACVSCSSLP